MPHAIRIAVAGLGRIGWHRHFTFLAKHSDFELVAVCDTMKERREEAENAAHCASYGDYCDMLERAKLDALVVATPSHLHKDMAVAALRRGLHVLLEKPMALNYREALHIARAANRHKRILTVYQPDRLRPYFQQLLHIIRSGKIGPIVRVQKGLFSYARRNDWQSLRRFGGGMLNNYGAHGLDQILQLVGYDIQRVFCHMQLIASLGDAEDAVKIVVKTSKGIIGDMDISQASTINPYNLIIWGTYGAIRYEESNFYLRYFDPSRLPPKRLNRSLASVGRKYCSEEIDFIEEVIPVDESYGIDVYSDFAKAIREGVVPAVKPEETLAVMRLIERCRKVAAAISIHRSSVVSRKRRAPRTGLVNGEEK